MSTIWEEVLSKVTAFSRAGAGAVLGDLYPALDIVTVVGRCDIAAGDYSNWRTVWPRNTLYTFSTAPEIMYVSSSSAADIGRLIIVSGLNGNFDPVTGYGITNGQAQSPVTSLPGAGSPVIFFRVNMAFDATISTTINNAALGNIYVAKADAAPGGVPTAGAARAMIRVGIGEKEGLIYTIPRGRTLCYVTSWASHLGSQQIILRAKLYTPLLQPGGSYLYLPPYIVELTATSPGFIIADASIVPVPLLEMTDFTIEAKGSQPQTSTSTLLFQFISVDNRYVKNLRGSVLQV